MEGKQKNGSWLKILLHKTLLYVVFETENWVFFSDLPHKILLRQYIQRIIVDSMEIDNGSRTEESSYLWHRAVLVKSASSQVCTLSHLKRLRVFLPPPPPVSPRWDEWPIRLHSHAHEFHQHKGNVFLNILPLKSEWVLPECSCHDYVYKELTVRHHSLACI